MSYKVRLRTKSKVQIPAADSHHQLAVQSQIGSHGYVPLHVVHPRLSRGQEIGEFGVTHLPLELQHFACSVLEPEPSLVEVRNCIVGFLFAIEKRGCRETRPDIHSGKGWGERLTALPYNARM